MNATPILCTSIGALGLFASVTILFAGPLNPPPGPVTSTYKTLTEVEPRIAINATNTPGDADSLFKITQPGSYYLTGNITGVVGKHGIEIVASGVTVDLNGFDIAGVPAMGNFVGVAATAVGLKNLAVLNGSVRAWGGGGINLASPAADNCRVQKVRTFGNAGNGISVGGFGTLTDCSSVSNTVIGIVTGQSSTVTDCIAHGNAATGISTGNGSTITNCAAGNNGGIGISVNSGGTIQNCSANLNGNSGIFASLNSVVNACSASSNTGYGIVFNDGCVVIGSTVVENRGGGILANNGCVVQDCLTRSNQFDGVSVNFSCTVTGNTCNGDGLAAGVHGGIHVIGQANRIENNNVTFADRGFLVDAGGNFIVRNAASGCLVNWAVAANNKCLVVLGANAAAINGSAGGVSPGSTDPNANYSY